VVLRSIQRCNGVKFYRRRFLHLLAGVAVLPTAASSAKAQSYPTRAITLVVPFPGGGPADVVGRIVAEGMRYRSGKR
jgi:tripartite-type tricarboxylate transporter receptor subunit TctC